MIDYVKAFLIFKKKNFIIRGNCKIISNDKDMGLFIRFPERGGFAETFLTR